MLSPTEKREMLEDAMSETRRRNFREGRRATLEFDRRQNDRSLDSYIQFLQDVQEIFGPFKISLRKTIIKKALL
ncbi:MAG: hypothetical protein P8123_00890 [bacterium]